MPLFKRNKANLDSISFPVFGWALEREEKNMRLWLNAERSAGISVNYFPKRPDLPSGMEPHALRTFYRIQLKEGRGGLIEVEKETLKGVSVIKTVFKVPQDPEGTTYLGSWTLPFKKCSFVIKVQAAEIDGLGDREKIIAARLLLEDEIRQKGDTYEDWASDPYKKEYEEGTLMNRSEEAEFDKEFPEHPLTQVRKVLDLIGKGIEFDDVISQLKPY